MSEVKESELDEQTLLKMIKFVHSFTGITVPPNRKFMLERRLLPRLKKLGIHSFDEYLKYVTGHTEEQQIFINRITTNETYFFRTPRIWEFLEKEFIPKWYEKNQGAVFQVWSAAASSGEEAHSLGMALQQFKELNPNFRYQIFGTDISQEVLSIAQRGVYRGRSIDLIREAKPLVLKKYFRDIGEGNYEVCSEIHSKINFELYNLFGTKVTREKFDLVLIRNVMIYFSAADQKKVLDNISKAMKKGSTLIIGESESLHHLKTDFKYQSPLIYLLSPDADSLKTGEADIK